ncbi:MAG TPA: tetratricopeptide repeat protein [Rhodanobacteraceae bacterium]|nr:tetratricopeptide repeat protein [Rhodanobacteraceae bacterium]
MTDGRGLLGELKRRHVWRVAIAYVVAGWLLVQVATQVFPFFGIPGWAVRLVVILIVIGFPVAVIGAWVYEVTPEGIRRTASADSREARAEHEHRQIGRKLNAIIVTVVVLAVVLLGWRFYAARRETAPPQTANVAATASATPVATKVPAPVGVLPVPAKSIAVLPFENLSNDKDNDYFVAGMQDLILTKLADIGDLKVIARTSTAKYASHPGDLKSIGRQLGVATILEGSVQKQGKQVLINVQLIDTGTQSHLWAQDYTRSLDNVFGVEGEVAGEIAIALDAKLSSAETANLAAVPTRNEAAYDLFLRAEYQANRIQIVGNPTLIGPAIRLYRQAIERDPGFALAYARLSYVESAHAALGGEDDAAQFDAHARADAAQALKLAPNLAAAQLALGYNLYWSRRDYDGALKAFATGLALRPNDSGALEGQGLVQRRMGRFDEAIVSFQRAFTQDPRNSVLAEDVGDTYMMVSRYPDAERWLLRALTLNPDNVPGKEALAHSILFGSGDVVRALTVAAGDVGRLKVGTRVPLLICQRRYREALDLLDSTPLDIPANVSATFLRYVVVGKPQTEAWLFRLLGEPDRARPLYGRVLPLLKAQLKAQQDLGLARVWSRIAEAELGLGHTREGLDAIEKSLAIVSRSKDRAYAPRLMQLSAAQYAQANRADLAVPLLARALAAPGIGGDYSPVMLWLDPIWDPIRRDARFQALLTQYARYKPAVLYDAPSVAH